MSLVSLAINYKLRPTYRRIGNRLGEVIADAVDAQGAQREKIIHVSEKAVSLGLSLSCAAVTADAAGAMHALSTHAGALTGRN